MAGKRLIDAAKLFSAGTNVAKQHVSLRRQQWEVYSQTSTLAKAVKNQTDRVTVTAAAAIELAKRFNESTPTWQQQQQETQARGRGAGQSRQGAESADTVREGVYAATASADTVAPETSQQVKERVQAIKPTLEAAKDQVLGSEAGKDDGTLSSQRKRELQRQAESQIPSQTADAQPPTARAGGEDTFSDRPESSSLELSSLPRTKLPRHVDGPVVNGQPEEAFPEPQPVQQPEPESTPHAVNTDVYSSPKVSQMLGQAGQGTKNPYAGRQKAAPKPLPEMVAAQERWQNERSSSADSGSPPHGGDIETGNLAAAIAQEAQVCSSSATPSVTVS